MKQSLKKLLCCLLTIMLTICGINKLGLLLRPTDTDAAYSQIETFHNLPEDSLEVIAYGSSHVYRGFDPKTLYNEYGIGSYNYGWNWQKINTTKLFILDSLRT